MKLDKAIYDKLTTTIINIKMHLAYSAFRNVAATDQRDLSPVRNKQQRLRYRGYQAACQKYAQEIAAIQQYLPDWQPKFK